MKYALTKTGNPRSEGYTGTVESMDDPDFVALKEDIRRHNAQVRETRRRVGRLQGKIKRVRVMGRGPRVVHAKDEGRYARAYDSYLPNALATSWDVYVHEGQ